MKIINRALTLDLRKEWDAKEKEMVAYRLVDLVGRASAANILGITVRELDKLVEIFEASRRFTELRDPSAAITWARELMGVSKKLLVPTVIDAVVKKVTWPGREATNVLRLVISGRSEYSLEFTGRAGRRNNRSRRVDLNHTSTFQLGN